MSDPIQTYELYEVASNGQSESWRKSVSDRDEAIEWMRQYWNKMNTPMYARIMVKKVGEEAKWVGELTRHHKKSTEKDTSRASV